MLVCGFPIFFHPGHLVAVVGVAVCFMGGVHFVRWRFDLYELLLFMSRIQLMREIVALVFISRLKNLLFSSWICFCFVSREIVDTLRRFSVSEMNFLSEVELARELLTRSAFTIRFTSSSLPLRMFSST